MTVALRVVAVLLFALGIWDVTNFGAVLDREQARVDRAACEIVNLSREARRSEAEDCGPPSPIHGIAWLIASGVVLLFGQTLRPRGIVAVQPAPSTPPPSVP